MNAIVDRIEASFAAIPLPLLEVWGRLGYWLGFALMLLAFGKFTLRPGGRWRLGRERQAWNARAFSTIPLTFVLIIASGYLGSFLVLVPGAQTFESLKDLVVFLCIVLFGYPALITVPFAYGLSDLIEGVPPEFLLDWLPGYFINPACFWIAYQLFGKDPDFRRARTWRAYLVFVLIFLAIEPVLWGYLCSTQFTPEISYRTVTPALVFTTGITWLIAPLAMLGALPLTRKLGCFWADIAGHVKERPLGRKKWVWESGRTAGGDVATAQSGVPIRMVILAPFIALVLVMVGATAYVTLRSAASDSDRLATWLHQEIAENINLLLDEHLSQSETPVDTARISDLLGKLPLSEHGRAFIIDDAGRTIASSASAGDAVVAAAVGHLEALASEGPDTPLRDRQFRFTRISAKPLSRETWLARATAYQDRGGGHADWTVITAMPESHYLSGIREGNSRSAMIFALALLLSLALAAVLAWQVTAPIRRISKATRALAAGELAQRLPGSSLEELNMLARSFNDMAERLKQNFDALSTEVAMRKRAEATLRESLARFDAAARATGDVIWEWDFATDAIWWNEKYQALFGYDADEIGPTIAESWTDRLHPDDRDRVLAGVRAAIDGVDQIWAGEYRFLRKDGSYADLLDRGYVLRDAGGRGVRMVGAIQDITERKQAQARLLAFNAALEQRVEQRTQELQALNRELETFCYSVSHDLRAPLRGIAGFTEILAKNYTATLDETARNYLGRVLAATHRMGELIDDLLKLSRVSRDPMHGETVDLSAIAREILANLRNTAPQRQVALHVEDGLRAEGDARLLRILLENLLDNAWKFTSKTPVARIAFTAGSEAGQPVFIISDNGVGFDMRYANKLFAPFQRLHRVTEFPGTGIGLATVQRIVSRHGGRIWVEAEPDQGATFRFIL
ncbi:MAG: PAS domain-containing protein [Burkholderiaceae bacterium]